MRDDKSSEFKGNTTAFNQEIIRSLQGMTAIYPVFAAFNKWLRRINGAKDTIEDVKDQNNQIFTAFMFLLNNDYLFYLTITNQFTVINDLFEQYDVRLPNPEILQEIRQSYDLALEHHRVPRIENNLTLDMMDPAGLEKGYFQIETSKYDLYYQLRKQYKHLHHRYQSEQTQAIRQIFNEFIKRNIEHLQNDDSVPEHVKEKIVNAHNEFEMALSALENVLLEMGKASTELDPELFSYDELPNLEDFFDRQHAIGTENLLQDVLNLSTPEEIDESEQEQRPEHAQTNKSSIPFENLPMSEKVKAIEGQEFSESNRLTETQILVLPQARPGNRELRVLMHKFNKIDEVYQEQRSRHGSLHSHHERHRKATLVLRERLAAIERRYSPALEHLSQKQELALNDIKIDLGKFIKLLISNLSSLEPKDKIQVMKTIKKMEEIETKLLNAVNFEVAQAALFEYQKELESLSNLFEHSGAFISFQEQYQELIDNLQQKVVSPPPNNDNPIELEKPPEPAPQPKYRRFAVKKMEDEYNRGEQHRYGFFDSSKTQSKMPQGQYKIKKQSHDELITINSEMEEALKNQIRLIKGTLLTKQETLLDKEEILQSANKLIAKIEQQDYKKVNPLDLHSLAMKLNRLIPDNKLVSELEELTLQISEQPGLQKSH